MTEEQFVEALKNIPLSEEEYTKAGVTPPFISRQIERYHPKLKGESSTVHILTNDPLIRLVNNYDLSKTGIGMICFDGEVRETDDFFYVGRFEADYLCVSKTSTEVMILAYDDPLQLAYKCARNSHRFLDALALAGRFLEQCIIESDLIENPNIACSTAEICAELSGNGDALNFYKVLLGCD